MLRRNIILTPTAHTYTTFPRTRDSMMWGSAGRESRYREWLDSRQMRELSGEREGARIQRERREGKEQRTRPHSFSLVPLIRSVTTEQRVYWDQHRSALKLQQGIGVW
mmetsp:Transcript_15607/g.24262  ORF Transcript_15607/g.24262 Transcript_15607/m.24262 type:complete len:108 (-) Transcript_15607:299-622(-)